MTASAAARDALLGDLASRLPTGHAFAVKASELAFDLGVSTRTVGALVEELVNAGWLIGSTCGERPGYFLVSTPEDLEIGTAHMRARAIAMLERYATVRRNALERFSRDEVDRLFPVDELEAAR